MHTHIKYTHELETNGSLPFLDVIITRNKESKYLNFEIYRKNITTDHVIPFNSCHLIQHKLAAFRSLFNRLLSLPLSCTTFNKEYNIILQIAANNGFPLETIKKFYNKIERKFSLKLLTSLESIFEKRTIFPALSYTPKLSTKISRIFKKAGINLIFKPKHTIGSLLPSPISKQNTLDSSGVYRLTCKICNKFYIGRTSRSVKVRAKEHLNCIKPTSLIDDNQLKQKSAYAHHVMTSNHQIAPSNHSCELIHKCNSYYTSINLECLEIFLAKQKNPDLIVNDILHFNNLHIIDKLINSNVFP